MVRLRRYFVSREPRVDNGRVDLLGRGHFGLADSQGGPHYAAIGAATRARRRREVCDARAAWNVSLAGRWAAIVFFHSTWRTETQGDNLGRKEQREAAHQKLGVKLKSDAVKAELHRNVILPGRSTTRNEP